VSRRRPGPAGGRPAAGRRRRDRSRSAGSGGGKRPGSGGTGPLRREGRLSCSQDAGGRAADGTGGSPGWGVGRTAASTGGRPPRAAATPLPGTGGSPFRTAGGGSSGAWGVGCSTRRAARRRPTALPWRASNCSTVTGASAPGPPSRPRRVRSGRPRGTPEPSASRVGCSPTGVDTFSSSSLPVDACCRRYGGRGGAQRRTRGTGTAGAGGARNRIVRHGPHA
jgi:hypothetical protein